MGTLERALPGRQNARDWLTLKIVECLSEPMDDRGAEKLAMYNTAYKALEQWPEDYPPAPAEPFTLTTAKNWVKRMKNEDGTTGAHWTFDQAHQLMEQRDIGCDPIQFWAALCMMYSDYAAAASKHGVGGDVDFYIDMACAFLNDKDAPKDKLARYYEHIAKG